MGKHKKNRRGVVGFAPDRLDFFEKQNENGDKLVAKSNEDANTVVQKLLVAETIEAVQSIEAVKSIEAGNGKETNSADRSTLIQDGNQSVMLVDSGDRIAETLKTGGNHSVLTTNFSGNQNGAGKETLVESGVRKSVEVGKHSGQAGERSGQAGEQSGQAVEQSRQAGKSQVDQSRRYSAILQGESFGSALLDSSVVKIPSEVLTKRLNDLKYSIIGRIVMMKGDTPWIFAKLREKLEIMWMLKSSWRLISLGRGFFQIVLTNVDDYNHIWMRGSLNLKPGILRLQPWSLGFDPEKVKNTHVQTWIRFYDLPWGFWESSVLVAIARRVGTPLRFDGATLQGNFGHFARLLVDVDLSQPIKKVVHVEYEDKVYDVRIIPENLPEFCKVCSSVGHNSSACRSLTRDGGKSADRAYHRENGYDRVNQRETTVGDADYLQEGGKHGLHGNIDGEGAFTKVYDNIPVTIATNVANLVYTNGNVVSENENFACENVDSANVGSANVVSATVVSANDNSANTFSAREDVVSASIVPAISAVNVAKDNSASVVSAIDNSARENVNSVNIVSANVVAANVAPANIASANTVSANDISAYDNSANVVSANNNSACENVISANIVPANVVAANVAPANIAAAIVAPAIDSEIIDYANVRSASESVVPAEIVVFPRTALDEERIEGLLKQVISSEIFAEVGDRVVSTEDYKTWIFQCEREARVQEIELDTVLREKRLELLGINDFYEESLTLMPGWLWDDIEFGDDDDYSNDDFDESSEDSHDRLEVEDEMNVEVETVGLNQLNMEDGAVERIITRSVAKAGGHPLLALDFGRTS